VGVILGTIKYWLNAVHDAINDLFSLGKNRTCITLVRWYWLPYLWQYVTVTVILHMKVHH